MKKIMSILAVTLFCCNLAFASNIAKFKTTLNTQGLDQAVVEAMAEGNSLDEIMAWALNIQGMNPHAVIVALLNAGADVGAVATAAANNGVSAQIIAQATQQYYASKTPLDQAVVEAMAEGNSLNEIMARALTIQGMNPHAVIVALLNAGADVGAVATAAANNGVSAQIIAQATQQYYASKTPQDTQAYTPAGPAPTIASIPVTGVPGGGGGTAPAERYASPSTF